MNGDNLIKQYLYKYIVDYTSDMQKIYIIILLNMSFQETPPYFLTLSNFLLSFLISHLAHSFPKWTNSIFSTVIIIDSQG